ncbi:hypothetical protein Pfo_028427 [Paulownia fortunei]|nr:hypothetical protein Pfo_028427 [Paulownia fortunei]
MSLHLGNLSSRTCRDDLERVFQRFGRCTIQVKDKYGFVVYDYPASAEKALKTLHRKRICGEVITLSWSNRQPRALQRFARGRKAYEPPHRKFSVKENVDRRLSSNDRRDYERDSKQADGEGRKLGSSDLVDESTSYHSDDSKGYVGERDHPSNDRHGIGGAGKNHLEDDWWGEQVVDPSSENCLETGIEFDSYEPYQDDDKKESDKHHSLSPLAGSASARKSQERRVTGHNDRLETSDYQKTCYVCGEVGHKMCKCPFDLKRHKFRSQGRPHPGADNVPMKHQESDREPVTSRNHWRLLRHGDAPPAHVAPRGRRKYFSDKKRNRRVYESQDKNHAKRARWPLTSSFHSDYTSSRSQSPSRSLESLAQFPSHSKSKSVTLNKRSPSSSRSSTSRHSGCKPFKCRSASRSMSPTFSSLPAELDRHFSPSSNQRQTDFKDSMVNAVGLAHCQEGKTMVRNGAGASISENITAAMENEFEAGPLKLEEEEMKKDLSEKEDERRHNVSKVQAMCYPM